jgi:hypothetical protein
MGTHHFQVRTRTPECLATVRPGLSLVALVALAAGAGDAQAAPGGKKANALEFEEVRLIIEFNSTDEDVGVQFFLDVDSWQSVSIRNPAGKEIFDARARGRLLQQGGGTEMFVESNEPTLDELSLDEFFELFPEGTYRFAGRTPDGEVLTGETEFSHEIPAGPEITLPVASGDECAANVPIPVVIAWNEVTETIDGDPIEVEAYEIIVEGEDVNFDTTMPADAGTSITVPAELLEPGTEYEFEVLAIAENGNQTITETCFVTAGAARRRR